MQGVRATLRPLAFALGGAAGELAAMLFARYPMGRYALDLFGFRFPLALALGAAAGALDGAGFELGCFLRGRRLASGVRVTLSLAIILLVLGAVFGLPATQGNMIVIKAIATVAIAAVAVGHGVVVGASERLGAFGAAMLGLLYGPVGGGLFGFAAGVAYALTYQPQAVPTTYSVAVLGFIIILILSTGTGLGLGIVLACAQGLGRLLVPAGLAVSGAARDAAA